MIDVNETLSNKIDDVLRPLGITRSFRWRYGERTVTKC